MSVAVITLALIALLLGWLLAWGAWRLRRDGDPLADAIENVLPQTQCAQCGFPGCRPYAEAIARGDADINQCPPGGDAGIRALAQLLGREAKALAPQHGVEQPPAVALIHEEICIGCTKCIQACPVDAIVGAPKLMHTVLVAECTGCELCIPPCPVDCISMEPLGVATLRSRAATTSLPRPIAAAGSG